MSELDAGVTLTPEENAFFDSKGATAPEPQKNEAETAKPAATSEPEAKEKVSGKEQEQEKSERVVPLAALHEERGKRKGLEQRLREFELENARFKERFKVVEEIGKKQEAPPPDPSADPFAYLQQVPNELGELKSKLTQFEQQEQQRTQQQRVVSAYSQAADQFRKDSPDFNDAYKHIIDSRIEEYKLIGHPDPVAAVQSDEFQIVLGALQQGRNPAEVIYSLAKARGFQAKAPAQPDKTAAEKLAQIEKGQASNKSLASAGGQSGAEEMTAEALLKMPMDEFEKWVEKNPAKAKRLMGG